MAEIAIRPAVNTDLAFISNAWLKSGRDSRNVKDVPTHIYYAAHHQLLKYLIRRSSVMIACCSEKPNIIYAFLVAEVIDGYRVVHYAYTKLDERSKGYMALLWKEFLLNEKGVYREVLCTHRSPAWNKWFVKHRKEGLIPSDNIWLYHPYLAFSMLPANWLKEDPK